MARSAVSDHVSRHTDSAWVIRRTVAVYLKKFDDRAPRHRASRQVRRWGGSGDSVAYGENVLTRAD